MLLVTLAIFRFWVEIFWKEPEFEITIDTEPLESEVIYLEFQYVSQH